MFDENSALVNFWYGLVKDGAKSFDEVPDVSNLREQVELKLNESNYDFS